MVAIEYCENAFFSGYLQPVNFISNMFIIFVGIFLIRYIQLNGIKDNKSKFFVILVFLSGIGSMTWHIVQTEITLFLDVYPIVILVLFTIFMIIRRITKNKIGSGKIIIKTIFPIVFFVVALLFRQIDLLVCNLIPFGTHFLWHLFNSFALYYMFLAIYEK